MNNITWSVMGIEEHIKNYTFECLMYGEDDEGNCYTGIAMVTNPELDPDWDEVTDIKKED